MDQLLFSETLQGATPSVSSLASAAPVTESLFTLSPAFSAVPPGEPIPPPLSEPFPPPLSNLSPNPITPLSDFASSSPPDHSLPSEPLPPLKSKLTVDDSPFQTLAFPSLPPHETQSSNTFLTLNTIVIDASITQDINPFPDLGLTSNATASVTYHGPPIMSVSPPPPPPHFSLTVTQPKSIHISSKPALENSTPDSTEALSTYVPQGTDHTKLSISHFFCQKACVRDPLLFTLAQDDFSQVQDMGYDSEKDLNTDIMSLSGANSLMSGQNIRQRQPENVSRAQLSKKSEENNEGQLPATVHSPWHAIHQTFSGQYHNKIKQRCLALSAGGENCLNTCNELPFLECSEQQKLEAHITKFHLRRMWALLAKVLKSIKIFKLRGTSSHSLSDSKSSSSTNLISERDSKSRSFQPVRKISKTLNQPHPVTSLMGKEGQMTLRQAPLNIAHGLAGEVQRIQVALQTLLPVTNSITGKESERHTPRANICPPKLSIRQGGDGHGPKNQRVNSSHGKRMKKSEPVSMPNVSRAEELDALQPKMNDILTTSKLGISQRLNVNESKGVTTVTTKSLPGKTSVFQDLKSANPQNQLSETKWKLENRKQSQAQGQHTHVSYASDSLTNKASLIQVQGVSSVDKSPQTPLQKAQSLPESLFRNQISRFFQWLHPEIKCQEQEYSQEKGSPLSSTQSRGPVKSKVDTGSFLEEKLGHAVDISCPQEPLPSAVKTENGQQKAAVCAPAEPVQGHPFNCRTPSFKETDTKSDGQEAVFGDKDRLSQKVLAFKDKLFNQKQPQSVPWRRTVPHPSPTCRPAAARGPPALTTAGGVVEINVYYADSNHLYRISRERRFPTPK
nr:spermatogenesis-associated protein 31D1-like [Pipistrellus kuhlii]